MALQLESIELEIKYSSKKAEKEIDKLADTMEKAGKDAEKASSRFSKFGNAISSLGNKATVSLGKVAGRMLAVNGLSTLIGKAITKSNEYVENLNLFTVAMGKYADSAKEYAENVGELLGIDPSDWMRNQGVFMTLGTGFGVASDKAALMSKNLTQLSYDLSSFYNISVADASQKLQSAFSGELEPVRRLGYDLSQTRLQQVAYEQGLHQMISTMTQAEKSQLRYIALIQQVSQVHGDMARTIKSPANQVRILQAQIEQLVRAIGNIFIPMLNVVLPYIIAFTKALRNLAQTIASFFGYTLPEVDYSTVVENNSAIADSMEDTADAYSGATKAAKAYKNTILGIDEIHKLNDTTESARVGGGAGAAVGTGSDFSFDLPEYDFLAGFQRDAQDLEETMNNVLNIVGWIGAGLLTWKIASSVVDFFSNIIKNEAFREEVGLALVITGVVVSFGAGYSIGKDGASWQNGVAAIGGILAAGLGGYLLSTTELGAALGLTSAAAGFGVGIGLALVATIVGIYFGQQQRLHDMWIESAAYAEMQALLDEIGENSEVVKSITIDLNTQLGDLDTLETRFDLVKQKVDAMYQAIEDGADVDTIQEYIDEINGFEINGLEIDYSMVTEAKDELYNLITALKEEAMVQGYQKFLVDAYARKAEAEIALTKSEKNSSKMADVYYDLVDEQLKLEEAKIEMDALLAKQKVGPNGYKVTDWTDADLARYKELKEMLGEGNINLYSARNNADEARKMMNDAAGEVIEQRSGLDGIIEDIEIATGKIEEFSGATQTAGDDLDTLGTDGKTSIGKIKDAAITAASKVTSIGTNADTSKTKVGTLGTNGSASINKLKDAENTVITKMIEIAKNSNTTKTKIGTLGSNGKTAIDKVTTSINKARDALKVNGGLSTTTAAAEKAFKDFGTHTVPRVQKIRDAVNDVNIALAKLKFPEMTSTTVKGTTEWYIRTNKYAQGGYPEQGQLFLAREAGPEMVGTIGGHTAVANNQDIVAGISQGVFNAMMAAGGNNGGTTIVQVVKDGYVESEQIINSADRRNRRDGKTVISVGS